MGQSPSRSGDRHAVVIANGQFQHVCRLLRIVDAADILLAADGGANWLASQGRAPGILVGDMDSVSPEVLAALEDGRCRLIRRPRDKDETDTELALLEAVSLGATRITILGALGGRVDHALANIILLAMPQLSGIPATIDDGSSRLSLVRRSAIVRGDPGDTLSLIPLGGDAEGIVTQGLRYSLQDETLRFGPARGVSNVFLGGEARVSLCRGTLLLVHTPRQQIEEGPL